MVLAGLSFSAVEQIDIMNRLAIDDPWKLSTNAFVSRETTKTCYCVDGKEKWRQSAKAKQGVYKDVFSPEPDK